jgi:hypothetical protein
MTVALGDLYSALREAGAGHEAAMAAAVEVAEHQKTQAAGPPMRMLVVLVGANVVLAVGLLLLLSL